MKKVLLYFLLLFVFYGLNARPNPKVNSPNYFQIKSFSKETENNWHLLTHQGISEKVSPEYYLPTTVQVKLKEKKGLAPNKKMIHNSLLSAILGSINVSSIELPYEQFVTENNDTYGISRIYEIKYQSPIDPYTLSEELMKNPEVEYATPVFKQKLYYEPNDPQYKANSQYALSVLRLQKAWDITKGNKNVKIAIVDSAIDWTHEDLKDNIWINPNEIPDNGIDDDGNGFVDDVRGWDFVGNISSTGSPLQPDNDTKPLNANNTHGTHTAGCASAKTDNNIGIASPGFNCSIIPCKVGADNIYVADILTGYQAILYAANLGADVINCSWGGPGYSPANHDVIKTAVAKGSVIVVAAGNTPSLLDQAKQYPAAFPEVLAVGSTGSNLVSSFSSYGVLVDVWAPGENILSTVLNNGYERQSGTSMASPLVAGICGLVKSIHPDWTPQQIMMQLRSTVVNRLSLNDASRRPWYFGMTNAEDAVTFNYKDPSKKVPGIGLLSTSILGSNSITSYESNTIKIDLKNYLSSAKNVNVSITPYDNWVTLANNTQKFNDFPENETKQMEFNLAINQNCPWFVASIRLLVTITADGNYTNYELIELPLNLPSKNEFGIAANYIAHPSYFPMNAMTMLDKNNGWFVGNDANKTTGLYVRLVNGTPLQIQSASSRPLYAVYAFDNLTALVGTGSDDAVSVSEVMITTDGGQRWTTVNTSHITGFINFIHFYDSNNGILLGDPIGNSTVWGCGYTTDGGKSWNLLNTLPPAQVGEDGLVGSGQFKGDTIWFGTTKGRMFYSSDRGKTWSVSIVSPSGRAVTEVSFMDGKTGIAVLTDNIGSASSNRYVAQTSDGTNWNTLTYNFTSMGLYPIYAFSPIDSRKQYILFSNGTIFQSNDNGTSWEFLQSRQYDSYILGDHSQFGNKVRLWQLGIGLTYLDFEFTPTVAIKKITLVDQSPVDFGDLEVTKSRNRILKVMGTGNSTTQITGVEFTPDEGTTSDEFEFGTELPVNVDVQSVTNIRVRFVPKSTGKKSSTIKLITDGEPYSFKLIGNAIPLSSVEESHISYKLYPNPASQTINLINPNNELIKSIEFATIEGKVLKTQKINSNSFNTIDISFLTTGTYILKIEFENSIRVFKLIVE